MLGVLRSRLGLVFGFYELKGLGCAAVLFVVAPALPLLLLIAVFIAGWIIV